MTGTVKITKRDNFNTLLNIIADSNPDVYDLDALTAFVNNEIAALDKKVASAKARAEKKRAEGDELRDVVMSCVTSDPSTTSDILGRVIAKTGDDTLSAQKITARLRQLEAAGMVVKDEVTVKSEDGGKSRHLKTYTIV